MNAVEVLKSAAEETFFITAPQVARTWHRFIGVSHPDTGSQRNGLVFVKRNLFFNDQTLQAAGGGVDGCHWISSTEMFHI